MTVLGQAERPMRMIEIHGAVEALLHRPVPRSTIKGCLASSALGRASALERLRRGLYRAR